MLISTVIIRKLAFRSVIAREWRVVQVPDEDCAATTIVVLYENICKHAYDPMEPFILSVVEEEAALMAQIGSSQTSSDFQSIPVTISIGDACSLFGIYLKLFLLVEQSPVAVVVPVKQGNAFKVFFLHCPMILLFY